MPGRDDPRGGGKPARVTADSGPWPLHGTAAAQALEALALGQHAPHDLMERAGLATARLARALAPSARCVEVWCGPGNNGGDGYVAARRLHEAGSPVRIVELAHPHRQPADASRARGLSLGAGVPMTTFGESASPGWPERPNPSPDLIVDALLGLGSTRAPEGRFAEAIAALQASGAPVLAVDLPSGLNADTGQPFGPTVVQARHTLALLSLKSGLFTAMGRDLAGDVWFDDLGCAGLVPAMGLAAPTARLSGPSPARPLPHASHKGSRGEAWIVGGAEGMVGAAWLAARAALAAGAGRTYVCPLAGVPGAGSGLDPARPEVMLRDVATALAQGAERGTGVVGCGGGTAVREPLATWLARMPRLVLDADALNQVALAPELQRLLQGRASRLQWTVLTPHPLEAARLLGIESAQVQSDRLAAAQALAERFEAVVVLKGSGSVIAAPGLRPHINPSGNAALATAGTGDVLAGWLGGLWAQRPAGPAVPVGAGVEAAFQLACTAVWQHGHAADVARPAHAGRRSPLLADDLIRAMAQAA